MTKRTTDASVIWIRFVCFDQDPPRTLVSKISVDQSIYCRAIVENQIGLELEYDWLPDFAHGEVRR